MLMTKLGGVVANTDGTREEWDRAEQDRAKWGRAVRDREEQGRE